MHHIYVIKHVHNSYSQSGLFGLLVTMHYNLYKHNTHSILTYLLLIIFLFPFPNIKCLVPNCHTREHRRRDTLFDNIYFLFIISLNVIFVISFDIFPITFFLRLVTSFSITQF